MVTQFHEGQSRPYVARSFPIPLEDRPVYFDLGEHMRACGLSVTFTTKDVTLLTAMGYTLVWIEGSDGEVARYDLAPKKRTP
jgi:hypothetical protein